MIIGQQCLLDVTPPHKRIRGVRGDQTANHRKANAKGALHTNPILLNHSQLRELSYDV